MLHIRDLAFSYASQPVVSGLSASIKPGLTFVRGGDGRGKTTLIRLLAGDLTPTQGGLDIQGISLHEQPAAYRAQVFWTDPRSEAHDQLTAGDFFRAQQLRFPAFDDQLIPALVEGLDLGLHIDKKLYMLSTGSKRKVWIAAAFASHAPVALLDMPFAAVDNLSSQFIISCLRSAAADAHRAIVFSGYEMPGELPLAGTIDLGD